MPEVDLTMAAKPKPIRTTKLEAISNDNAGFFKLTSTLDSIGWKEITKSHSSGNFSRQQHRRKKPIDLFLIPFEVKFVLVHMLSFR